MCREQCVLRHMEDFVSLTWTGFEHQEQLKLASKVLMQMVHPWASMTFRLVIQILYFKYGYELIYVRNILIIPSDAKNNYGVSHFQTSIQQSFKFYKRV